MTDQTIEVRAHLGKVSFGKGAASVRVNVPREDIELDDADRHLCRARIQANIEIDQEAEDQQVIEGLAPHVSGAADVTTISVDTDHLAFTLGFSTKSLGDEGATALRKLSQSACKLRFLRVGDANQSSGSDGHAEGGDADDGVTPRMFDGDEEGDTDDDQPADPEAWKREPITSLKAHGVKQGTVDALARAEIDTLGDLADYQAYGADWHTRIKGAGPEAAESIEAAQQKWYAANPHLTPDVSSAEAPAA